MQVQRAERGALLREILEVSLVTEQLVKLVVK
jgi:hypothetical protein